MVDAEYSGVLFTRDPSAGGLAMVEMVQGTAENLVSGTGAAADLPLRPRHQEAVRQATPRRSISVRCSRWATSPSVCSAARRTWNGPIATAASISCRAATSPGRWPVMRIWPRCRTTSRVPSTSPRARRPIRWCSARTSCRKCCRGRPRCRCRSWSRCGRPAAASISAARELGLTYRVEDGTNYLVTILGRLYVDKREEQSRALVISPLASRRLLRDCRPHRARLPRALPAAVHRRDPVARTWSTSRSCRRRS